jgi:LDH2 family malate/lactate/ureidoglycolate dehydrogenase
MADQNSNDVVRVKWEALEELCAGIFTAMGIPADESADSSAILVAADARGIPSHGVARINRYAEGIRLGVIKGGIPPLVLRETPITATLDAQGAMGLSVSKHAMEGAIARAKAHGIGVYSVRNSNHFGIAGYYSEMAARAGLIGIAMTNTAALGVPTFGREAMFGTNPIAFAAPALGERLFSLDMATTCVTRGKVEVYNREGKTLPAGWAVGTDGLTIQDPAKLLADTLVQKGGGMLPLGGEGELLSGHKGYGLAVMVDILTALLAGGEFGHAVRDLEKTTARVCHFFLAMQIDLFRSEAEFRKDLSAMLDALEATPRAEGAERVYYAGLKSEEAQAESRRKGVPLKQDVWKTLTGRARSLDVAIPALL